MKSDEAESIIMGLAKLILANVPASEWRSVARRVSIELMKISNTPASQSGTWRLEDDRPTIPPPKDK